MLPPEVFFYYTGPADETQENIRQSSYIDKRCKTSALKWRQALYNINEFSFF